MPKLTKAERDLVAATWAHYHTAGRHHLPWRRTTNPYQIVVSEIMLQQTQAARVIPKYRVFVRQFPNTKRLAQASLADVLVAWSGLGYNRRARLLWKCAQVVHSERRGRWPRTAATLRDLPGIGPYTAGAVAAFAFNQAVPILETNIRTVYLHHLFPSCEGVPDAELERSVERTLDTTNPREWYAALMDYGAHLKATVGNQNRRSRSYQRQSGFVGSRREVRGAVVRHLGTHGRVSETALFKNLPFPTERLRDALTSLIRDGLVMVRDGQVALAV